MGIGGFMKNFIGYLFLIVLLSQTHHTIAQTNQPLDPQTMNVVQGASCFAEEYSDEIEDEELSKSADDLEKKYNDERKKLKQKIEKKSSKDPYNIEAALKFFAPSIFPEQYSSDFTNSDNMADLGKVSNIVKVTEKNEQTVKDNRSSFNTEKVNFTSGNFVQKDGTKIEITKEQQAALDAYKESMLDVLMDNKSCDQFSFNLDDVKFRERYFENTETAKKFVNNHEQHADRLERCEGPFERKSVNRIAAPIAESEKELECEDLQNYFLDNQWELDPTELLAANGTTYKRGTCTPHNLQDCDQKSESTNFISKLQADGKAKHDAALAKVNECVSKLKNDKSKKVEILGVDIESSASRYKNTGISCDKSFAQLSELRAKSAEELLFQSFETNGIPYKEKVDKNSGIKVVGQSPYLFDVNINADGEWGSYIDAITKEGGKPNPKFEKLRGSSGPAPGELENKSDYDQYKYVRIKIRYKEKVTAVPAEFEKSKFQVVCKSIGYSCIQESEPGKKIKTPPQRRSRTRKHFDTPKPKKVHHSRKEIKASRKRTRCTY